MVTMVLKMWLGLAPHLTVPQMVFKASKSQLHVHDNPLGVGETDTGWSDTETNRKRLVTYRYFALVL